MSRKKRKQVVSISFRRRLLFQYKRFILILKISILALLPLLLFTDLLDTQKSRLSNHITALLANYGFVLQNVIIEGDKNISIEEILDLLGAKKGDPLFAVDLAKVKDKLENNSRVKKAHLKRIMPSAIHIAVSERQPIAIWQFQQKLYLIDSEGNRIVPYNGANPELLIHVVGQDANIYAQSLIDDLNKYPNIFHKLKSAVRYGQRRWDLNLEGGITVKMPEKNFLKAYDYLGSLDRKKKLFDRDYEMLDLRDSSKYFFKRR